MIDESDYTNFNNMSGFFRRHTNNVLRTYSTDTIRNFKNLATNEDRVRFIYELDITRTLDIESYPYTKDLTAAEAYRMQGNEEFRKKKYKSAITSFSYGIQYAPQNTAEGRKLLGTLASNRSAAYYFLEDYDNVIQDTLLSIGIEETPFEVLFKVWVRKGRTHMVLEQYHKAKDALKKAQHMLPENRRATVGPQLVEELQICEDKIDELLDIPREIPEDPCEGYPEIRNANPMFPAASSSVTQTKDPVKGRYMIAAQNISAGEFLVIEEANAAVLIPEYCNLNCSYCFLSIERIVPCPGCINVVFCSEACMGQALMSFHQFECTILQNLWDSGASINCMLALRMITTHRMDYFRYVENKLQSYDMLDQENELTGGLTSAESLDLVREEDVAPNLSHDYVTTYKLCHHAGRRIRSQYLGYANMAVYLLRLLKTTQFFDNEESEEVQPTDDSVLTDDEALIGGLILRNLQVLEFNAHEISELRMHPDFPEDFEKARTTFIGAGVYPTIAYFNHSCDPGIIRYNQGTKMVVRSIRDHAQGAEICENYGPIFSQTPKEERKMILRERYWFECACEACENDWPVLTDIDPVIVNFRCKMTPGCDGKVSINPNDQIPFVRCCKCNVLNNLVLGLKALQGTDEELRKGDEFLKAGEIDDALKSYLSVMHAYTSQLVPPYRDYVYCAQKIRICGCALGNRMIVTSSPNPAPVRGE